MSVQLKNQVSSSGLRSCLRGFASPTPGGMTHISGLVPAGQAARDPQAQDTSCMEQYPSLFLCWEGHSWSLIKSRQRRRNHCYFHFIIPCVHMGKLRPEAPQPVSGRTSSVLTTRRCRLRVTKFSSVAWPNSVQYRWGRHAGAPGCDRLCRGS